MIMQFNCDKSDHAKISIYLQIFAYLQLQHIGGISQVWNSKYQPVSHLMAIEEPP